MREAWPGGLVCGWETSSLRSVRSETGTVLYMPSQHTTIPYSAVPLTLCHSLSLILSLSLPLTICLFPYLSLSHSLCLPLSPPSPPSLPLTQVNGQNVVKVGHRQVVNMIRQGGNSLMVKVVMVTRNPDMEEGSRKKSKTKFRVLRTMMMRRRRRRRRRS